MVRLPRWRGVARVIALLGPPKWRHCSSGVSVAVSLLVKNLLFTLVVPASVGVYVPLWLARGTPRSSGVALFVALALFTIATGLYAWSVWNFAVRGQGTPLPLDAPKRLVILGPYRYTRNPMYLALFSALLGWLLLYPIVILAAYTVGVVAAVYLFVVGYEEPHLRRLFGVDYDAYMSRVPRWLPGFPPRRGNGDNQRDRNETEGGLPPSGDVRPPHIEAPP